MQDSQAGPVDLLLVDDHPANLLALEATLQRPDYHLVTAASGPEALGRLKGHSFAAILLDVQMPGMDGFETARRIRGQKEFEDTPIIFVTAIHREPQNVLEGYASGGVDYIFKPIDPDLLRSKVAVFVDLYRKNLSLRRNREQMAKLLMIQRTTTEALAGARDVDSAIVAVQQAIGNSLEWEAGVYWEVTRSPEIFDFRHYWTRVSDGAQTWIDELPPRRSWTSKHSMWSWDKDVIDGLSTSVVFPIRVSGTVVGLMEFFSDQLLAEDPDLVKVLSTVADQLGLLIGYLDSLKVIREKEARKTAIQETALDCIVSMDHEGRITEFNRAAEMTFGYRRDQVIGKEMAGVLIPPRLREGHRRGLKHYLVSGEGSLIDQRLEMSGLRADGSEFPIEVAVTRVAGVEPPLFTGFLRDISERQRIDQELRNSQRELRETLVELEHLVDDQRFLVKASDILSASLDYSGTMKTVAELTVPSLADWCSIDVVDESGNCQNKAMHPSTESFTVQRICDVIKSGKSELSAVVDDELRVRGARSMMVVPLVARGNCFGAMTLVSTKKGRRYSEEDLSFAEELGRRAASALDNAFLYKTAQEAIEARNEFLSIASHELKTPITSLRLQLDMTKRTIKPETNVVPSAQKLAKVLDISSYQVERLTNLVEHLLDVSQIQAGKLGFDFEDLDLSSLVCEIVERMQNNFSAAKMNVEVQVEEGIVIQGDRFRIDQVVTNLLTNALKYGGGKPVLLTLGKSGSKVMITVKDSGIGIEKDKQSKIFERFERAASAHKISGLGLGLYITHQIVSAHHGEIHVESELGQGSKFTVELPVRLPVEKKKNIQGA